MVKYLAKQIFRRVDPSNRPLSLALIAQIQGPGRHWAQRALAAEAGDAKGNPTPHKAQDRPRQGPPALANRH